MVVNSARDAAAAAYAAGDYVLAEDLYTKLIEGRDSVPGDLDARAAAYMKLRKHTQALADAERLMEEHSALTLGYTRAALVHLELNQLDRALELVEAALALSAGHDGTLDQLVALKQRIGHRKLTAVEAADELKRNGRTLYGFGA
ncbi:hypothetical protein AURDEDRAFT_122973 [Auricularia subglabra TFB-10046 SS5]|nr:hypothetical protein AURDEDRAFT_122973 [Auricularia subglabra TFB-10046 SS5]